MKKVVVIVLSWNKKKSVIEVLESLKKSATTDIRMCILVVDNGSTDDSPNVIREYINKSKDKKGGITWELITNSNNLGFVEGNNIGISHALQNGYDYVVLLNDDAIVGKDCISSLVRAAQMDTNIGAVSPKIYFFKGFEFHKSRYSKSDLGKVIWYAGGKIDWDNVYGTNNGVDKVDKGQFEKIVDTDFATGCCVLLTKEAIEKCGMLNTNYYMYLEDADISRRFIKNGFRVIYYPKAKVWHKVAQSSGIGSELNDYFITRNRMLFGITYARFRTKVALVRESIRLVMSGRKWQKRGIIDFYVGRFGVGSWNHQNRLK